MKKLAIVLVIVAVAALLFALTLGPKPAKPSPSIPNKTEAEITTTSPSQEAARRLPEVITLFQKGDGESDLALFVAAEMEKDSSSIARFKKIDVANDPEVAAFYGVNSIPAVIIKAASGRVLVKHEGYMDKDAILDALKIAGKS